MRSRSMWMRILPSSTRMGVFKKRKTGGRRGGEGRRGRGRRADIFEHGS